MRQLKIDFKETSPVRVISSRKIVPKDKILDLLDDLLCWAFDRIIGVGDPHFVIIHEDFGNKVDAEACIPLLEGEEPEEDEEVKVKEISGEYVAYIVHKGKYEGLEDKIKLLYETLKRKGVSFSKSYRIVYIVDFFETSNPNEYITEIQVPVRRDKT
ncbi:MAG: GyrI-like domain-containing protein [Euryarchaeota archaeon]|nr:GyrI-like domain-containing protein [Euryarchaeota archaeon]